MNKNLLIGCVGPESLHQHWISDNRNFDLMLVHYGDDDTYCGEGEYYLRAKGTKFNIIGDVFDQIPEGYEYIFIPDDDLYMTSDSINRLFEIAAEYQLKICQPSLVGYYSVLINLHHPGYVLRYTDYVEIIAPCFSRDAFEVCRPTFKANKSCWGIDVLWDKLLDSPKDAIAVVDEVIAVHTRPCFWGDNYRNNGIDDPYHQMLKLVEDNGLTVRDRVVYSGIPRTLDYSRPSETRVYPDVDSMPSFCKKLRRQFFI